VYKRHQAKGLASAFADPIPGSPECGRSLLYSQIGHVQDRLNARVLKPGR
jgi:hypothetical protein